MKHARLRYQNMGQNTLTVQHSYQKQGLPDFTMLLSTETDSSIVSQISFSDGPLIIIEK